MYKNAAQADCPLECNGGTLHSQWGPDVVITARVPADLHGSGNLGVHPLSRADRGATIRLSGDGDSREIPARLTGLAAPDGTR
jgi:hypothetical protein